MKNTSTISISNGNIKMGDISSISLPAGITCDPKAPCFAKCYARKMCAYRETVRNAYERNLDIYKATPRSYWLQLQAHCSMVAAFRFHVSGDIPDREYLDGIVSLARKCPSCQFLLFTKRASWVNDKISLLKKQKSRSPKIFISCYLTGEVGHFRILTRFRQLTSSRVILHRLKSSASLVTGRPFVLRSMEAGDAPTVSEPGLTVGQKVRNKYFSPNTDCTH